MARNWAQQDVVEMKNLLDSNYTDLVLSAEVLKDEGVDAFRKLQGLVEAVEAERDEDKKAELEKNAAEARANERKITKKHEKLTKALTHLPALQEVLNIFLEADAWHTFYQAREDERDESEGRSVEFAEAQYERSRARQAFVDCVQAWGEDEDYHFDPVEAREQERISRAVWFIMRGFRVLRPGDEE